MRWKIAEVANGDHEAVFRVTTLAAPALPPFLSPSSCMHLVFTTVARETLSLKRRVWGSGNGATLIVRGAKRTNETITVEEQNPTSPCLTLLKYTHLTVQCYGANN